MALTKKIRSRVMLSITVALLTMIVTLLISNDVDSKKSEVFPRDEEHLSDYRSYYAYDQTTILGSEVIHAIRRYSILEEFTIRVVTRKNPIGTTYINGDEGDTHSVESIDYVNPLGLFNSSVELDENNNVTGIVIKQK